MYRPYWSHRNVSWWAPRAKGSCKSELAPYSAWHLLARSQCIQAPLDANHHVQLDPRISATVCYFATDVHSRTLGPHDKPDLSATAPSPDSIHTIDLLGKLKGEVSLIFGLKDTHVPDAGRDLIRAKLREAGVVFSFHEFAWAQHAFIRDELSKGRYDPAISKACFEVLLELFGRTLKVDLGPKDGAPQKLEHVC